MDKSSNLDQVERDAKQRWNSDAAIRAEFQQESTYIAFCKAEARGAIHILGKSGSNPATGSRGV